MGCNDFWFEECWCNLSEGNELYFHKLIVRIVEIYIDDMVVKSKGYKEYLADLRQTLECTRKHGLKMNPNKCAFGVSAGPFFGFMVHERGIKIGQKSIKAIERQYP